jgi:hypothetical protein
MLGLLLVLSATGACGGGGGDPDPSGDPASGDGPPPQAQTVAVGSTFWHSGFEIEVVEATLTAPEEGFFGRISRTLTVPARFTNQGEGQTSFSAEIAAVTGGNAFPSCGTGLPQVPSGLTSDGEFCFLVPEDFDLLSSFLLVGRGTENQARVPLGPAGGDLVALAPHEAPLDGEISLELIDLTFTMVQLRADVPHSYSEVEQGRRSLWLHFDVTSRRSGNWTVRPDDFALILPGGSAAAAAGSQLVTLPGTDDGLVTEDLFVRFIVNDPVAGGYTLRFTAPSWFVDGGGATEGTFDFTL